MLPSDWSACVLLLLHYICSVWKGWCLCVCVPAVHLQPYLWHLSCSGACPVPRSWPPLCYRTNNTSASREGVLTNLPQDGPFVCGRIATLKATTQPQSSTVTSLHPLRSTQFWRPTSTALRFVAPFLSIIITLFRFKCVGLTYLPLTHQAVPCRASLSHAAYSSHFVVFSLKSENQNRFSRKPALEKPHVLLQSHVPILL